MSTAIERRIEALETAQRTVAGPNPALAAWFEALDDDDARFLADVLRRYGEFGYDSFEATLTDDDRARWSNLCEQVVALR